MEEGWPVCYSILSMSRPHVNAHRAIVLLLLSAFNKGADGCLSVCLYVRTYYIRRSSLQQRKKLT